MLCMKSSFKGNFLLRKIAISFRMVYYVNYGHFFLLSSTRSAWLIILIIIISVLFRPIPHGNSSLFTLHSSLSSPFISVCKGTHYFFPFPKIAKKLPHFNIRLHGFLTFRHPSMCHIAMVGE